MDVVRNADWIIDLGPEGGSKGGQVMFEGTPADFKKAKGSITSQYI
jgi:excinuclease UvrABC ATPase subunit